MQTAAVERPFGHFERMLALRYLRAKREHGGLALISIVSVIGITLAVAALIITMSVMNGFRLQLLDKIVGFEPHIYVRTNGLPKAQVEALAEEVRLVPGVLSADPLILETALASANGFQEGVEVRGVKPIDLDSNPLVNDGIAKLEASGWGAGSLEGFGADGLLSKDVVVGRGLAQKLGLFVGDRLTLTGPRGASTVVGTAPRTRSFTVKAIFDAGYERYDRFAVFLPIDQASLFFNYDESYPLVAVRTVDPSEVERVARAMQAKGVGNTTTWKEINGTFVTALEVERNLMRLIMFIVVTITALNIITGVLMLVKNKARDVAILRTIGATRSGVVRIFLMTGTVLGSIGVGTGLIAGVLFCLNIGPIQHALEAMLSFQFFPKDIYMLDALPARIQWSEVGIVAGWAFLMTLLSTLIPSMWASRLDPVEALRFQ